MIERIVRRELIRLPFVRDGFLDWPNDRLAPASWLLVNASRGLR